MVVDDSAIVRGLITRTLKTDPRIEVTASCSNGEMAVTQAAKKDLDVIILDIEMPVMDGLTALPKLQQSNPQARIIMASTLTQRNAGISLKALALGAADYIAKPTTDRLNATEDFHRELIQKVIALGQRKKPAQPTAASPRPSEKPQLPHLRGGVMRRPRIIAIGSSTGGPQALLTLLGALPPSVNCPIVIAQHMPATFTGALARRLDGLSQLSVVEVGRTMPIVRGCVYIGKGDADVLIARRPSGLVVLPIRSDPKFPWHPSVDRLVESAMDHLSPEQLIGVLMTGMGNDGATAMARLHARGGRTIAEAEETAVVWGMPGELVAADGADWVLPLREIATWLRKLTP
jgi:two-component system chemotaxis response regulator CheB